jgi:hypothetical protein
MKAWFRYSFQVQHGLKEESFVFKTQSRLESPVQKDKGWIDNGASSRHQHADSRFLRIATCHNFN